jgi:hypothetical protein
LLCLQLSKCPTVLKQLWAGPGLTKIRLAGKKISGTKVLAFPPQCWEQVLLLEPFFFINDAPKNILQYSTLREGSQTQMQTLQQPVKHFRDKRSSFSASMLATDINVETFFHHH